MNDAGRGVALGAAAYLMWGLFPLYFPLLEPAGSLEILAHRVVWSTLTVGLLVLLLRLRPTLAAVLRDRRTVVLLCLAALAISVNWGAYIYGVTSDRVVETALGYFINPLVTVLMGVLVLKERLRPLQWAALGIAAVAVVVLGPGLRAAAVGRDRPGPVLRLLRAGQEDRLGRCGRVARRGDRGAGPAGPVLPRAGRRGVRGVRRPPP